MLQLSTQADWLLGSCSRADCNCPTNLQALLTSYTGAESQLTGHNQTHNAAELTGCSGADKW